MATANDLVQWKRAVQTDKLVVSSPNAAAGNVLTCRDTNGEAVWSTRGASNIQQTLKIDGDFDMASLPLGNTTATVDLVTANTNITIDLPPVADAKGMTYRFVQDINAIDSYSVSIVAVDSTIQGSHIAADGFTYTTTIGSGAYVYVKSTAQFFDVSLISNGSEWIMQATVDPVKTDLSIEDGPP